MGDFKVDIDISSLTQYLENFTKEVTKDIKNGVEGLTKSAHLHMLEETKKKLPDWDREKYEANLSHAVQITDYLWEITLSKDAANIEEGRKAWDMKGPPGGLLHTEREGSKGKIKEVQNGPNKGKKYRVIPFQQGKSSESFNPTRLAEQEERIKDIKTFLKAKNVPLRKLEIDSKTGSPRLGKLHSFDIPSKDYGKGTTPRLFGLTIYQTPHPKTGKIQRTMTTFRTAMEGDGKWMRDAIEAAGIFPETKTWAEDQWANVWLPQILQKYQGR
jgi:hypothetical protein